MYLSLHKDTALLGEARFELDAGKALIIDFQPRPDAAGCRRSVSICPATGPGSCSPR